MEAIKHSKIIIILLVLYTAIAIAVVTLDKKMSSSKKEEDKKKSAEVKISEKDFNAFIEETDMIREKIQEYVSNRQIVGDTCIAISIIIPKTTDYTNAESGEPKVIEYTGSVYISQDLDSVKLWYKSNDLGYAVNNVEINGVDIEKDDIEEDYSTSYYNSCGLSE